jgi:hypothetical protein
MPAAEPELIVVDCCAALAAQRNATAKVGNQRSLDLMTVLHILAKNISPY